VYELRLLAAAEKELEKLDAVIARRMADQLRRLAINFDAMRPELLSGELSGLYKLRVGDYRAIYEVLRQERTIIVHQIGHRREIYRQK
jgi:mRNA interferase RelE/StbE